MSKKIMRITTKQMVTQWEHLAHQFEVNVWNFEVNVGKAGVEVFKKSFDLQRFNTSGSSPWEARRTQKPHPILVETGTLKNSIKWKKGDKRSVVIYTDPKDFVKRGFCYAATHNDPSGTHTYGYSRVPSVQRQFIGHSTVLDRKMQELEKTLFRGFPI